MMVRLDVRVNVWVKGWKRKVGDGRGRMGMEETVRGDLISVWASQLKNQLHFEPAVERRSTGVGGGRGG